MKLGLVIDLDTCVGCHACATACKQWNTSGTIGPLSDSDPYAKDPIGTWLNRIRTYEVDFKTPTEELQLASSAPQQPTSKTVHMPMSCMQCDDAACVTVCPTGASYKREEDGIVLIDQDKCMGCNLCAWACPYGARELDQQQGVMKKCTLCVDRIYDEALPEAERQPACVLTCPTSSRIFGDFDDPESEVSKLTLERGGKALMPELGYQPTNRYLPPRDHSNAPTMPINKQASLAKMKQWVNKVIAR
jgi:Fe-S-cluster-containing dehydrogenase component